MRGDTMTEKVLALVDTVFPDHQRAQVTALLRDDIVGPPRLNERIHLAAIQLSEGNLVSLKRLLDDACVDFRNLIFDAQAVERHCAGNRN